ncbi:HigA family addiction module antidote protein [Azospirillum sp. YIM B02556]|uniref:HigA family addiction module antidote protein n=1 Tax=Azospirillum endophyticum TaxID=2800326 RepID=A0ABS1F485_9PROT|nr:HigA family addiction module antitoxin [Azospirillum endophyticum]MBK1838222.1 HigA family addiction module antidote protein [Azospirillum endophyticum]
MTSPNDPPPHPGAVLRDRILPELRLTVTQAARELAIARQTLHRVLAGKAGVTPEMAARLSRLCDIPARFWLDLQLVHDLWYAQRALGDTLDRIPAHVLPAPLKTDILTRHGCTH